MQSEVNSKAGVEENNKVQAHIEDVEHSDHNGVKRDTEANGLSEDEEPWVHEHV